jgi:hypothetical protein
MVKLAIYPDNFTEELETTIQTIVNMSDDPQMKAIVVNQAVPGTAEAFRQIKERRPDILCIAGESHEDIALIESAADLTTNIMLDQFVEDGSFIRCSDVTLGYTLPKSITKKLYINKVRVYASASNLFILTKYSGYDPEVDVQSGLTPSMDYNRYPRARTFSFGLNVTF